jgi:hypothetical protein
MHAWYRAISPTVNLGAVQEEQPWRSDGRQGATDRGPAGHDGRIEPKRNAANRSLSPQGTLLHRCGQTLG